jgi:phosphopantothenoylcysteine synthetase/decarboxylase
VNTSSDAGRLRGRRILITAGPTWVPIDAVRHLGNRSSGSTGLAIARSLVAAGGAITLLLGPGTSRPSKSDRAILEIRDFETFDDLHALIRDHLGTRRFDAVIHAAAVSDYRPAEISAEKLSSEHEELVLRLIRTPKIVDEIKELDPGVLLVKFKLEVARSEEELLAIAEASRLHSRADLIVANDLTQINSTHHKAYLLDATGVIAQVETTEALAAALSDELGRRLGAQPFRSTNQ